MKVRATVYQDAEGQPRFVLLPDGRAYEVGQLLDQGKAQLEKWGAEQIFLASLTPEQRAAWDKLQRAR